MKVQLHFKLFKIDLVTLMLFLSVILVPKNSFAQVTFVESSVVTNDAFYFWKADDPKPYHYAPAINPHGNCMKVSNGFVFYTWYRGGWADRTLMVSRKKIGEGSWVHVELPAKLSLVGGKGDTHLTTNIGICPIDGTIHLMFDHHNEDLNYIRSKKNIAYGPDSDFTAANFLPQQDYLIPGKKITSVTYPDLFNNDLGEMYFERRLGSAVGGNIIMTYYNGDTWSQETTIIQGTGPEVTQGERGFSYGSAYYINGKFYYAYSPRWAESPTKLGEGVYVMELGSRMNDKATTVDGKSYDLPVIDHAPFLIADPRSVPDDAGWAGGPQLAISPKNDIYMYINPKGTNPYNYLKTQNATEFTEDRNKGSLGVFYGNRMYKFNLSGGVFVVTSALAGTYTWREDYRINVGINDKKSITVMDDGTIVVVFGEAVNSDKVPIHCYVFHIQKEEYTAQTISFDAIAPKTEGDANFTLNATSSSGLPVSFVSSDTNIARIVNGNEVQIMGVGSCNIIASQKGNGTYDQAPDVAKNLVINANTSKSNQTITFSLTPNSYTWGNPEQALTATASSGLPVQYESTNTDVAVIVDGKIQVKRAGITTINALQTGDAVYNAAPIVSHEYSVPIRQQVINFQAIPNVTSGDPAFGLVATSNNPEANLKFICPNNQVAVVWDNQVRQILGAGTATITVSDTGNDYFTSAQASRTITVNPKIHQVPSTIEAEYYTSKNGVNVTRWSNTVFYLNAWEANDFAEYTVNVPTSGTYELEIFAASPGSTKKLKIMQGSSTLASLSLTTTNSLTIFKGTKANITLQAGVQNIKIVGEIGGFNFDKMKISSTGQGGGGGGDAEGVYQLVNVATGKYLGANSAAGQPVIMHDTGDTQDRKWTFMPVNFEGTDYYNIDSQLNGILRATGGAFALGAYLVVSTGTPPGTAGQTDKIWTIHYDEFEDTYRFEAKSSGRFLYHETDGDVYNLIVDENDDRSKWQIIGSGGPLLSVNNDHLKTASVKVYPNPANSNFTIALNGFNTASVTIYDILGKPVYRNKTNASSIQIENDGRFKSGMYLIKVVTDNQRVYHTKLVLQ